MVQLHRQNDINDGWVDANAVEPAAAPSIKNPIFKNQWIPCRNLSLCVANSILRKNVY